MTRLLLSILTVLGCLLAVFALGHAVGTRRMGVFLDACREDRARLGRSRDPSLEFLTPLPPSERHGPREFRRCVCTEEEP